MYHAAFMFLL